MQVTEKHQLKINKTFSETDLLNGLYIVILHAKRTPPHIGLIVDKQYHSLTIKGHEINVSVEALIRNVSQRKIPSLFVKIKPHLTFSSLYLKEHFITTIAQFPKVAVNVATCLSPIKQFFEENYAVSSDNINYLFDLLPVLEDMELIEHSTSLFIDEEHFHLPLYNLAELNKGIDKANEEAAQIKKTNQQ
ncbi:MAG: hypothetical protein JNL69_08785 [Bacteroidia bacterium]|nr:hypothetical protein [Bacteroidia bacterium]